MLACQLRILSIFYSDNKSHSAQELAELIDEPDILITAMLADLAGYGIVTAYFDTSAQLKYQLTLFGQYFYDRIRCKQDGNA